MSIRGAPGHAPVDPGPALAMLVVGVPMLVVAGFLANNAITIMRHTVTTQARVVRVSHFPSYDRRGGVIPGRGLHAPVVALQTPDGRMLEVLVRVFAAAPCCQVNDRVTVRFPPGAPERALIVRPWDTWLWPGVLGLGGLVLSVAGLVTWRIARRRPRPMRQR